MGFIKQFRICILISLILLILPFYPSRASEIPKKIIIVGDSSYAPFEFNDEQGMPRGFTVDFWRLWSKKTGISVDYRCMDWADALNQVKEGKADVVGGLFFSPERDKAFDFSPPFYTITTHLFFHKNIFGIKDLHDVKGFQVGVVKDDYAEEYMLKNFPSIQLIAYPSSAAMVRAASDGKLKIFLCDTPVALFFLEKFQKTDEFRYSYSPVYTNKMYSGVKKGNAGLLKIVNKGFKSISKDEINKLERQWVGYSIVNHFPWRIVLFSGGFLGLLIAFVLLWNVSLRQNVSVAVADLEKKQTELEESEKHASKIEERFRTIFETSKDAIIAVNSNARITMFNQAAEAMFGYCQAEVLDKNLVFLVPEASRNLIQKTTQEFMDNVDSARVLPEIVEMSALRKDGTEFFIELSLSRGVSGGEHFFFSIIRDVTERKHLESKFMQSQKLEAVGQLAGGIAHDLNNLLSPILGYSELMLLNMQNDHHHHDKLVQIRKAADSARSLTQQLLAFGRRQVMEMKTINLNTAIREFEKILRSTIREDITIRMDLSQDLWNMKGDVSQIQQIIMNLSINAQDALPHGGIISITTANEHINENNMQDYQDLLPGNYVMLAVKDTGMGIDDKARPHIFEPFFTTKEKGRGTGLGLSTVHGIVKQHKGNIQVLSESGNGSVFKLYLPRAYEGIDLPVQPEPEKDWRYGNETIMVVEDNRLVLDMAILILQNYGYKVLEAGNALESIQHLRTYPDSVNLLLTDVIMPEMNGRELYEKLAVINPTLKVLYMSGYPDDVIAHQGVLYKGINFIQKPFTVMSLIEKVRAVLDSGETTVTSEAIPS